MINYIQHVAPLDAAGKTDLEIVAILGTYTVAPMPILELKRYLRERGILNAARNKGSLISFADALPDNHPLVNIVDMLTDIMLDNRDSINTTVGKDAVAFHSGLTGLQAAGALDNDDGINYFNDVLALAGGLKYPELTVADIVAGRDAVAFDTAVADLVNTITGAVEIATAIEGVAIADVQAAAVAAATNWSA